MLLSGLWEQLIIGGIVAIVITAIILTVCELMFKGEDDGNSKQ